MKYMGSKAAMLKNGLGTILLDEARRANGFADLFAGSAAVTWFIAQRAPIPVHSSDLQQFSSVLALAVTSRKRPISASRIWDEWLNKAARALRDAESEFGSFKAEHLTSEPTAALRVRARKSVVDHWCPLVRAYGGYYFSPRQIAVISALRRSVPRTDIEFSVATAALIRAASTCSASPGHTAQPFGPSEKGSSFLLAAWRRDVLDVARSQLELLAQLHALSTGTAATEDALTAASRLKRGDVAFVDPPYSNVQYSRFYHVLESIAQGTCSDVAGTGRYPPRAERPQSRYSTLSSAEGAFTELLDCVARSGARVVLTFPERSATNGLSGARVERIARRHFSIDRRVIEGRFSTLGGSGGQRPAQVDFSRARPRDDPAPDDRRVDARARNCVDTAF